MIQAPTFATTEDGARVRFDIHGHGPALVFVHGLGDDRQLWSGIVGKLENDFTCVVLDLRGHGESSGVEDHEPFGLHRDIHAVLTAARVSAPLLIGHSLGGIAVTTAAARSPVRGVINVDQPLDLSGLAARVKALGKELYTRSPADIYFTVLGEGGVGPVPPQLVTRLHETRAGLTRRVLLDTWQPLLTDVEELTRTVTRHVSGISAPYLSLHGSDPGAGYVEQLRRWVPRSSVEVWPEHAHFPHLVDEQRFVARVRAFWKSAEEQQSSR